MADVQQPRREKPAIAIETRKLNLWYGTFQALFDIDLDIKPGEFVVLLGPSGCGKSTLLYLIAGLERETSGEIWSFHERIEQPSPNRSLIFQETSLFPWLTVWQNVAFGLSISGMWTACRGKRSWRIS